MMNAKVPEGKAWSWPSDYAVEDFKIKHVEYLEKWIRAKGA
jgi:hypothetical protein